MPCEGVGLLLEVQTGLNTALHHHHQNVPLSTMEHRHSATNLDEERSAATFNHLRRRSLREIGGSMSSWANLHTLPTCMHDCRPKGAISTWRGAEYNRKITSIPCCKRIVNFSTLINKQSHINPQGPSWRKLPPHTIVVACAACSPDVPNFTTELNVCNSPAIFISHSMPCPWPPQDRRARHGVYAS